MTVDIYDARGKLCEEPDPDYYMAMPHTMQPQFIRLHGVIWVQMCEGHWLRFSGATAALEAFDEAERRWDAMSDEEREEVAA